ncbi:hypothetical protein L6R52_24605, partial [Myxococcota bacterium]|nr:hypothetical protein [Myxococcota bacterium]
IEHELGRDNVGAAAALARQLQPPAPELDARIEATRARLDARAAKLAKLEADRNLDTGLRTRAFLSLVAAFSWAALPLGLAIAEQRTATPASYVHYLGGFSVLAAGLVWGTWWARDSLTRTAVNRQITASVWVLGLGLLLVVLAGLARGVPLEHTVPAQLVVLVVATFTIAIASDLRLALAAIFPAVAFVATLRSLEHALYWAAAAKFCSFLAAAIIWRPRTWAALTAPPPGRARWRRARAGRRL